MLTDDETRAAFAQLRADELPRVAGPGSAAARRTVRRRRVTVAVAVTTVLAAAGTAAVLAVAGVTGPAPSTLGTSDHPVPTGPDLVRLGEQAARTLAAEVPGDPALGGSGPMTSIGLDAEDGVLEAGRYRLTATCLGAGTARFEVAQNGPSHGFDVACDGSANSVEFDNRPGFTLYVRVDPDDAARDRAGFAYRVDAL
jgi:hypothetical protein